MPNFTQQQYKQVTLVKIISYCLQLIFIQTDHRDWRYQWSPWPIDKLQVMTCGPLQSQQKFQFCQSSALLSHCLLQHRLSRWAAETTRWSLFCALLLISSCKIWNQQTAKQELFSVSNCQSWKWYMSCHLIYCFSHSPKHAQLHMSAVCFLQIQAVNQPTLNLNVSLHI